MALTHWTFGMFWTLWPTDNLHRVVSFYDPRVMAFTAMVYVGIVTLLWRPRTLRPCLRRDAPADLGAPGPDRLMDHGGTRPSGQRRGATRERCPRRVEEVGRPPQFGSPLRVS